MSTSRSRDALGRVVTYREYVSDLPAGQPGPPNTPTQSYERDAVYDAGGRVTQDTTIVARPDGTYRSVSDYYYNAALASGLWSGVVSGGAYMGGAVTRVVTRVYKNNNDGDAPDTLTVNGFAWGQGGPVLARVDYDKDTGSSANTVWYSSYTHDGLGYLTGAATADFDQSTTRSTV